MNLKLYSISFTRNVSGEAVKAKVWASTQEKAFEALELNSMEWKSAKVVDFEIFHHPKEGEISSIEGSYDNEGVEADEEER